MGPEQSQVDEIPNKIKAEWLFQELQDKPRNTLRTCFTSLLRYCNNEKFYKQRYKFVLVITPDKRGFNVIRFCLFRLSEDSTIYSSYQQNMYRLSLMVKE